MVIDSSFSIGTLAPAFEALSSIDDAFGAAKLGNGVAWIGVADPGNDEFSRLSRALSVNDMRLTSALDQAARSCLPDQELDNPEKRFRATIQGGVARIVLRGVEDTANGIATLKGEVELIATTTAVVVITRGLAPAHQPSSIREEIQADLPSTRVPAGGDVVAAVISEVIEWYSDLLDDVESAITVIADELFVERSPDLLTRLYALARPLHGATVAIQPLSHRLGRILKELGHDHKDLESQFWLSEADYLANRIARLQVSFHSTLQMYVGLSQDEANALADERNEITQKMSAYALLFAIPTIVFSIYGTNFKDIPLLKYDWSYPVIMAGTLSLCIFAYVQLRRSGWL